MTINPANLSLPTLILEEADGPLTEVALAEGKNIVEIITNAFSGMLSGITGAFSEAFNALVLNEAGTGLSMTAIWSLVFMGVGLLPRGFHWLMGFFTAHKKPRIN